MYFKDRAGNLYTKYTKEEIYSKINPFDWDSILPWLKELNYPAIKPPERNIFFKCFFSCLFYILCKFIKKSKGTGSSFRKSKT